MMKQTIESLAIFGGVPAFDEHLHVGRPNIGDRKRLQERVNDILDSRWLSNGGVYVQEFEQRIADLLDVKHCIAVCNATAGLEILAKAAGLSGEVIIPSFTFIATAHALQWQNITPVFCDITRDTYTIDPVQVERMITPQTTGIIGVHTWGRPCDVTALTEIARRCNLKLLFDAAHAFGCSYQGRMIGNFGNAEVFSFHATKFVNSLEGGAMVTNDDDLAAKLRLMKNFGFVQYDETVCLGINAKMSEVSAAMGLASLESMDEFVAVNYQNYMQYQSEFENVSGINLLLYDEAEKCNYQYVVLEIDETITHISRDQLIQILYAENILARRYFYPGCHRMEPYLSNFSQTGLVLPETESLADGVLSLPTGTTIGPSEISQIGQIIRLVMNNVTAVHQRMITSTQTVSG